MTMKNRIFNVLSRIGEANNIDVTSHTNHQVYNVLAMGIFHKINRGTFDIKGVVRLQLVKDLKTTLHIHGTI